MKSELINGNDKMGKAVQVLSDMTEHLGEIKDVLCRDHKEY